MAGSGGIARDANPQIVVLDLDLAEAGLGQKIGKLADEILVDDLFLVAHWRPFAAAASASGLIASSAST